MSLRIQVLFLIGCLMTASPIFAQSITDDFEGNGNITSWAGDDCGMDNAFANPYQQGINPSATVLKYTDIGGQYANVRFDAGGQFDLSANPVFSLKIYIDSNSLTGAQPNQISLKLQDATLGAPWSTQCEIIKSVTPDQWQTVTFDFANDPYINLDPNSPAPTSRTDFNRVLIQINGENNNDLVTAYVDDFVYQGNLQGGTQYTQLVWADEFNGTGAIDTSKWHHQTLLPNGNSWYNGEVQHYTDRTDNSYQANGNLYIMAKKEVFTDQGHTKNYTSARLNSKFAFTYGRVEARAKLPAGAGTWPAIWMLGKNINEPGGYWTPQFGAVGWPACGEIDIMEHWGHNPNYISSAMHTPSSSGSTVNVGGRTLPDVVNNFHVYALDWTPTEMIFSVDGIVHYTYAPPVRDASTWPFDADQYILLNVAMVGSIDPNFTQSPMVLDYIRVYQGGPGTSLAEEMAPAVSLYPNPVTDRLNIQVPETFRDAGIQVFNPMGQLVHTDRIAGTHSHLEWNQYPKGIYLVVIESGQDRISRKVLKQ